MEVYYKLDDIEVGLDEVARGCLFGRVYAAAVIWGKNNDPDYIHPIMKDSKKFTREKREIMYDYITDNALDYAISYIEADEIDETNILKSTMKAMHQSLDKLNIQFDNLLVDGNYFKPYISTNGEFIPHICFDKGDTKFYSIAAASILAKVEHDRYIQNICEKNPSLNDKYSLLSNMGYGTKAHMEGIRQYGITEQHRKSYKPCQILYYKT